MPAAARSCARTGDRSIQALPGEIGIGHALSHEQPAPASPRDTRDSLLQCGQDIRQCSTIRLAVARCLVPESTQPRAHAHRAQPRRADRASSASPGIDSCPSRPPRCSSVRHNSGFKSTTASDTRPARGKNHDTCNRECQLAATQRDEWQRGHHHCGDPLGGREAGVADIRDA
jgi:hypothetical protein